MASRVINLRIEEKLITEVDAAVKGGLYASRSDFIKNSIRDAVVAHKRYLAMQLLEKYKGHGKGTKIGDLKKARELAWETLR